MVSLFLLLGCNLSYIVVLFAALHELASASARTLLKLAFPSFALRIPTAHDFCVISAHISVQNIRDFPQTKLDGEIKALFLLNEHGDPHFLFYKFNENNIRNN